MKPTPPSGCSTFLVMVLLGLLPRKAVLFPGCRLSEFMCENEQCISLSKFCDGMDDCGDSSDEHPSCTNCNKTYYGQVGVKYPFRLTEPVHRHLSYVCSLTFVAGGDEHGDVIEITLLSFQVGIYLLDSSSSSCQQGHMRITELWNDSQPITDDNSNLTRRSVSTFPQPLQVPSRRRRPPKVISRRAQHPSFGYYCGSMIGKMATFYSDNREVKVTVTVPSFAGVHASVASLYLTYKFLPKVHSAVKYGTPDVPHYMGERVPHTYCDRVFTDCHIRQCKVQSPNYPGFYLRNISCHYWIRQLSAPSGHIGQIIVSQPNEYKINLFSGYTSNDGYTTNTLTSECANDVIRIFDGKTDQMPLLGEFCGAGALSPIISSGPEMLIQLYSAPYQLLFNSRVELNVEVRFVRVSEMKINRGKCAVIVDGSRNRSGVIQSPNHTMPPNTTCSFHFRSDSAFDRVWIYFLSYFVPDLHTWSAKEKCDITKLEMYDPFMNRRHTARHTRPQSTLMGRFCEKSSPNLCGHAFEYSNYLPQRPCKFPEESYLSTGPELLIKYSTFQSTEIHGGGSSLFLARYEFVNMKQSGYSINNSICDRKFVSRIESSGHITSPQNLFLFGRGGRQDLSCSYQFRGLPMEKLRITIHKLLLPSGPCLSTFDSVSHRHHCVLKSGSLKRYGMVNVTEHWQNILMPVGCMCDPTATRSLPIVVESLSSNVDVTFRMFAMNPEDDFTNIGFEASYEFVPFSTCNSVQRMNGSEGVIAFTASALEPYSDPLRCRWLVVARPLKFLYLRVVGKSIDENCLFGNRYLLYSVGNPRPFATLCTQHDSHMDLFSKSWSNESLTVSETHEPILEKLVVEIVATVPGSFHIRWLEVTKPFIRTRTGDTLRNTLCSYECPELHACISEELWCDGIPHCPAGYDEVPEQCYRFPTLYVAVGASVGVLLLFVATLVVITRCCYQPKSKGTQSVPTEEVQNESNQSES